MSKHLWSVLCSRSITDAETNNLSLIDIVEQFSYAVQENIPIIPLNGVFVTLWMREHIDKPEKSKGRTFVEDPQGNKLFEQEYDIDLTEFIRIRINSIFGALPYKGNGMYHFSAQAFNETTSEWNTVANLPILITKEFINIDSLT